MTQLGEQEKQLSRYYVTFIDILYAVVLAQALSGISTSVNLPQKLINMLSLPFLLFIISVVVVLTDWVVYHKAISLRPHKNPWRFFIDIVILFFFFQMARSYEVAPRFFYMTTGYFCADFLWTFVEFREYPEQKSITNDFWWNGGLIALFLLTAIVIARVGACLSILVALVSFVIYLIFSFIRGF